MFHNTKSPLVCCPRCHKTELLGRTMRRPTFRYDRVQTENPPASHRIFHGELHVATLSRSRKAGPTSYEVQIWDTDGEPLRAGSLQDARALAEATYTTAWRDGLHATRGPVMELKPEGRLR